MKYILTIANLAIALTCYAQNSTKPKYQVKLYGLISPNIESAHLDLRKTGLVSTTNTTHFFNPTFAVNKRNKKGNKHELELTSLSDNEYSYRIANSSDSFYLGGYTNDIREFKIAIRYEYIQVFFKNKKLQPAVGIATSPYLVQYRHTPRPSVLNPFIERAFGVQTFIIPRLNCYIGKRFLLDLNIPFKISEHQFSKREEHSNNTGHLTTRGTKTSFFENLLTIRFGVGLNI